jgi:hypothetical protein
MYLAQFDRTGSRRGRKLLTLAARRHGAQCWLWLAAFFAIHALCAPAVAASDANTAPPVTPEQATEAREFLGQLADQAGDLMKLMLALGIVDSARVGPEAQLKFNKMLLDAKHVLEASNVSIETLYAPPSPTGDALFDRYAAAVDQRMAASSPFHQIYFPVAVLSDTELSLWEPEFGNDPRYWELRYFCASAGNTEQTLNDGFSRPSQFLAEAARRGIATANTLLLLAETSDEGNWKLPPDILHNVESPGVSASDPDISQMQQMERERLAVINAAVKLDARQAWDYYERAMYWFELGEQERGLADLQAGNAAPDDDFPRPWPLSQVQTAFSAAAVPGSPGVCGAVLLAADFMDLNDSCIPALDHLRESLVCTNLSGDISFFEPWHQFACRIGAGNYDNISRYRFPREYEKILLDYYEENAGAELTAGERETLDRIRGACAGIPPFPSLVSGTLQPDIIGAFDLSRGFYVVEYLKQCELHQAASHVQSVFADLSQVHYPELALPECMKKYEALSAEEQQRRVEERRKQYEEQSR